MRKFTKIIATIGPSSDSEEMIKELIQRGVNVFRFNFKHSSVEWHNERILRVNKVAHEMGVPIAVLIDLQGPEIRINMPGTEIEINEGELLLFGEEAFKSKEKGFSISHPEIVEHLAEGQQLVADDGAFEFVFHKKNGKNYLESKSTGILKQRKSLNIPGADFPFPVLVERDFDGLELAQRNEVDYVALSFVRSAEDIKVVKKEIEKYKFKAKVVAKIETKKALDNLDKIIAEADAVMVARGDLGVELPIEEVPYYQKIIIRKALEAGKAVITATQMLASMEQNPFPSRAEISDIANAAYDLTDAVMLSGETAAGKYPLRAVEYMAKTIRFNESKFSTDVRNRYNFHLNNSDLIICDAAYNTYVQMKKIQAHVAGFLVCTQTGKSAHYISRYRPLVPIFAFTPYESVYENLALYFGVYPFMQEKIIKHEVTKEDVEQSITFLKEKGLVKESDMLIVVHGNYWGIDGGTSTLKIVTA